MQTIKRITAEVGEECNVDIDVLHDTLLKLPAEIYLKLYRKMHEKVLGYPPFVNFGGCCGTIGDLQEDNKSYADSLKESECKDSPLTDFTELPMDKV